MKQMANDKRYVHVKSRLQAMREATGQQEHDAMEDQYPVRELENMLDELVQNEPDEFEKSGEVYRWKKSYRVRMGV